MEITSATVVASGLVFPEGPIAMPDGSVLVVEIRGGRLTRILPDGSVQIVAKMPGWPNGAAIGPDGKVYICNNGGEVDEYIGGKIQRIDVETGRVEDLYVECDGRPLSAPNDIVFDTDGGFWFTDLGKIRPRTRDRGGIYYASADGDSITEAYYPADSPNGIGVSPDGASVYWSETFTGRVFRQRIDRPVLSHTMEMINPIGLLCGLPGGSMFDSLAIEECGNICVATLNGSITVLTPDGDVAEIVTLPRSLHDPHLTNICFGGDDLRTAYITLSRTGCLISCPWPRPGLRLAFSGS